MIGTLIFCAVLASSIGIGAGIVRVAREWCTAVIVRRRPPSWLSRWLPTH